MFTPKELRQAKILACLDECANALYRIIRIPRKLSVLCLDGEFSSRLRNRNNKPFSYFGVAVGTLEPTFGSPLVCSANCCRVPTKNSS
jgi:hypothetical protein